MQTDRRAIRQTVSNILDKYSVLCPANVSDDIADAVILLMKNRKPTKPKNDFTPLAKAIAEVCEIDFGSNRGLLFHEARLLSQATPPATPELVRKHYGDSHGMTSQNWYKDDWRGLQCQYPKPSYIRQTWLQIVGGQKAQSSWGQRVVVS